MPRKGLLSAIKSDVEKTGSNRGKFFYVKSGTKTRIRFLEDIDDGRIVPFHDRWDPQLKVPCKKGTDEDADCHYCGMEGVRNRDQYAWSVWDYEANEVKVFMFPANQCSPVPSLAALYDTYGTITDRDFSVSRSGSGTGTTYSVIPLDKSKFRNAKAKPLSEKAFWKLLSDAFPDPDGESSESDDDEDDEEVTPKKGKGKNKGNNKKNRREESLPWEEDDDEDEDNDDPYEDMSDKELFKECKNRDINVKPRMESEYYIKKLKKWDKENAEDEEDDDDDDDDDFWADE